VPAPLRDAPPHVTCEDLELKPAELSPLSGESSRTGRADFLDRLAASLPGSVRRGYAPPVRADAGDRLATGILPLDAALDGGLPRGCLSELVALGATSTGVTTLAYRLAASVTSHAELVAWVDGADAFDPASAAAAGLDLSRMLWVRPPELALAPSAAELVLAAGGFPLVVIDLLLPADRARRRGGQPIGARRARGTADPLRAASPRPRRTDAPPRPQVWIRLARAAAAARATLVVLNAESASTTGSFSSVRLELMRARARWSRSMVEPAGYAVAPNASPLLLDGLAARVVVARNRGGAASRELSLRFG